jgi:hypothetical protein
MEALLEGAKPSFEYLLDRQIEGHGIDSPERVRKTVAAIFESLANIDSSLHVELRLKEISNRTGVGFEALKRDWESFHRSRARKSGPSAETVVPSGSGPALRDSSKAPASLTDEARKGLIGLLLLDRERLENAMGKTFATLPEARKYLDLVLNALSKETDSRDGLIPVLRAYLESGPEESKKVWDSLADDRLHWEVEAVLREDQLFENPLRSLIDYVNVLRKAEYDRRIAISKQALLAAEKRDDWESVARLAAQIDSLVGKRESVLSHRLEEVA